MHFMTLVDVDIVYNITMVSDINCCEHGHFGQSFWAMPQEPAVMVSLITLCIFVLTYLACAMHGIMIQPQLHASKAFCIEKLECLPWAWSAAVLHCHASSIYTEDILECHISSDSEFGRNAVHICYALLAT
jgi:Fe2+ transport system protein B